MLDHRYNKKHKRKEYCLVSEDKTKILRWFGQNRPSPNKIKREERRVRYWENKGK